MNVALQVEINAFSKVNAGINHLVLTPLAENENFFLKLRSTRKLIKTPLSRVEKFRENFRTAI